MKFKTLLDNINPQTTTFVVGNGINLYADNSHRNCDNCGEFSTCKDQNKKKNCSWQTILKNICYKRKISINPNTQSDLSFPEIASLVKLYDGTKAKAVSDSRSRTAKRDIRQELCSLMKKMEAGDVHRAFIEYARRLDIPVITTNFDKLLSKELEMVTLEFDDKSFFRSNRDYLWNVCYKDNKANVSPTNYRQVMEGFGIWHIHGNVDYPLSIKIGLEDYVNSIAMVKTMISGTPQKNDPKIRLYQFRPEAWVGRNTLLDLFFHRDLIFLGLSLDSQEVFLRWLIMQRAIYQSSLIKRGKKPIRKAWYVHTDINMLNKSTPKGIFFNTCGIKLVGEKNYDVIYQCFK